MWATSSKRKTWPGVTSRVLVWSLRSEWTFVQATFLLQGISVKFESLFYVGLEAVVTCVILLQCKSVFIFFLALVWLFLSYISVGEVKIIKQQWADWYTKNSWRLGCIVAFDTWRPSSLDAFSLLLRVNKDDMTTMSYNYWPRCGPAVQLMHSVYVCGVCACVFALSVERNDIWPTHWTPSTSSSWVKVICQRSRSLLKVKEWNWKNQIRQGGGKADLKRKLL